MPRDLLAKPASGPRDLLAVKPPSAEKPSVAADVAKSGLSGAVRGVAQSLAIVPDTLDAAGDIGANLMERFGSRFVENADPVVKERFKKTVARLRDGTVPTVGSQDLIAGLEKAVGELHKPETTAGEYAETIGEFAPSSALGPGGIVRRTLAQTVVPALASETAGQLTEGTELEPYARVAGAAAGALVPAAASRAVTPFPAPRERLEMVETLKKEGVPLSAGQVTGNRGLQYAESMMGDVPFGSPKARELADRQGDAFSAAAMRRVGEDGPATPENVKKASDRIKAGFEDISSRNNVVADQDFANDFLSTIQEYARVLTANQKEVFANMAGDIVDRMAGGAALPGKDYQQIRSRLSRMSNAVRTDDPEYSQALRGLRNALDNAFSRQVSPDDAGTLRGLRKQYGNMKTVEKAVTGAGEQAAFGRMSPAKLRESVAQGNNRGAYARGEGDFAELARAGQAVMTPLPNSGTAQRSFLASLIGGGAGAGAVLDGGVTAATTALAPALVSRAVFSGPGQKYLSNQVMTRLKSLPAKQRAAIVSALAARGLIPAQQEAAPAPAR